ncbi:MAG: hypothetical protein GF317_01015 [Candidatus Lokiarchaeota archaeon]|nr:hypothetical protein [Candidatus Lokiarchaeota archaeon]MBD3198539.1 hypothetical protein [Candidatus Lokiarchaeota archaeon]
MTIIHKQDIFEESIKKEEEFYICSILDHSKFELPAEFFIKEEIAW